MKMRLFFISLLPVFAAEVLALVFFALQTPDAPQDTVAVNEVQQSVVQNFDAMERHENRTALDYVVLGEGGALLYRTREGLSESLNTAIAHRDTILDIERDGERVGRVIVYNNSALSLQRQKKTAVFVLSAAMVFQCGLCLGYGVYLYMTVIHPFQRLKEFTRRVAGGNLDIPLEMDRHNLFGAFTESFDIMRSELKKARMAEAQANAEKKELVAKLSHDIKTPVASIKAVSEVGLALVAGEKDRANYTQIIGKADQINRLVSNLFTATLEELQQLTVTPEYMESGRIKTMLENADYLHRAILPPIPACLVYADALRLQQVLDNLFANSYKYAKTDISVTVRRSAGQLGIEIEDFGGGVNPEELPTLKEKFKRGSNSAHTEGAGLGLYISDYFMKEMRGELQIANGVHGLRATVLLYLGGNP